MSLWKCDPTFTNYVPRTAEEAVGRFVRCRDNGLSAMMIPECLIECSRGLNTEELNEFEQWIINPAGPVSLTGSLVETTEMTKANNEIYGEAVKRFEATKLAQAEDEKREDSLSDVPLVPAILTLTEQTLLERAARAAEPPSATEAPANTPATSSGGPCRLGAASG